MSKSVSPESMYVYYIDVWCLHKSEESITSPGIQVSDDWEAHVGSGN